MPVSKRDIFFKFLKRCLLYSVVHFCVSFLALLGALTGLGHSDDPNWEPSWIVRGCESLFSILAFPVVPLWEKWGSGLSDFIEWMAVFGNSLLWGICMTVLLQFGKRILPFAGQKG